MSVNVKKLLVVLVFVLIFFIVIVPSIYFIISYAGRISPDSVLPDSFIAYMHIPNPMRTAKNLLAHHPMQMWVSRFGENDGYEVKANGIQTCDCCSPAFMRLEVPKKRWMRFIGRGSLDGVLLSDGKFLAAWDSGILASAFIRFFPRIAARQLAIPNLRYVRAGKWFEYRGFDNIVLYMRSYKNLLLVSNDLSVLGKAASNAKFAEPGRERTFYAPAGKICCSGRAADAWFVVASEPLAEGFTGSGPIADAFLEHLNFGEFAKLTLSILPERLDVSLVSSIASNNASIDRLISRDSKLTTLMQHLPANTQFSSVFSIGSIEELLNASLAVYMPKTPINLRRVDSTARLFFGTSLNESLYSWSGTEIAVLVLEDNHVPVFVLQIADEQQRREIFEKVFAASAAAGVVQGLGGTRISRISLPGFLNVVLGVWNIRFSTPHYIVQNDFLFLSESPEALLSVNNSIYENKLLSNSALWKSFAPLDFDESSLTLFYSLDGAVPFFIRGNDSFEAVLGLYRQALIWINISNNILAANLSVVSDEPW